jgi:hypothetical protein
VSKTYRGALVLALTIALLLPATAEAAVPGSVTKGLDYLHTRQRTDGGFSYINSQGSPFDTPWVMLAIAAGQNGPARWKLAGRSPVGFLQNTALNSAAATSGNAPEYYSLCILAYLAAGRTDLLSSAGSTQIDLVGKLESYQSITGGYYSPATPATTAAATETTAWAVLGLVAAHQSGAPLGDAVKWLYGDPSKPGGGPNSDGGFGSQPNSQSSTTVTSLAIQALVAARPQANASAIDPVVQGAAGFLEQMQMTGGGFPDTKPGFPGAPSTAWAIEGLNAAGVDPHKLVIGGKNPYTFLQSLRQRNGSTHEFTGNDIGNVMKATTQATIALTGKRLPIHLTHDVATRFDPRFNTDSVRPKNGARFASHTVLVHAGYHDNVNGTGIRLTGVRVSVDGKSKTRPADITTSRLRLQLTKLANGSHTFTIIVHDWAGNVVRVSRSFTVAVPVGGGSTGGGTHPGNGGTGGGSSGSGTGGGTVHTATPTPKATISPAQTVTPGVTLTPTPSSPFPSSLASPSPSASISGQVAGSGGGGGGGHAAAVVGTTLAILLPLGVAGSWLVRRRLLNVMDGATRGEILPPGSSVWQRFWKSSGGHSPGGSGE